MTSTGKRARKRYGNRFAAKARREPGARKRKSRRTFGALRFSNLAGNVPFGVMQANAEYCERIAIKRHKLGQRPDANTPVSLP